MLYPSCLGPLFALFIVFIPATLGRAVAQEDDGTDPVAVNSEISASTLGGNMSPVVTGKGAEAGGDCDRSHCTGRLCPLAACPFPTRPISDNSTRFQDKENYTDPDAPIVTSFRNSSNLTTYHIEDTEVFGRSSLERYPPCSHAKATCAAHPR